MTLQRPTITKAVIPAAGRGTRHFPASAAVPKELFPLVDVDGVTRTVAHIIIRSALAAGIEEIALVVSPGQESLFRRCFAGQPEALLKALDERGRAEARELEEIGRRITYVVQPSPDGFGHAVWCAREFAGGEPFLLMLGDHIPLGDGARPPAAQVVQAYAALGGVSVTGVQVTPAERLHLHGTAAGVPLDASLEKTHDGRAYRAVDLVEKPDLATARSRLLTPGLPEGMYLTMFGLYAFGPALMETLDTLVRDNRRERGEIQLATAQAVLIRTRNDYYLYRVDGRALDMGTQTGLAETQTALLARGNNGIKQIITD